GRNVLSRAAYVRPRLRTWAIASALFAGTVLLFSRATDYGLTNYDDPRYVTANPHVQEGLTRASVAWAFGGHTDYWHPLTWLSHMLDWQLYGEVAAGHHLTSSLWHAANAVLAFLVLRRLTGSVWASAFSAALFVWHPLRVESVVWITERKDVMSGCFFLLTLWAYAAYSKRRDAAQPAWTFYALTLVLFVAGLMSKPMLVSLPLVLLVVDYWPLQRGLGADFTRWRGLLLEKIPFFALSVIASVATALIQVKEGAFVLALPLGARLGNAVVAVVRYIGKFFWPFDLSVAYPHPGWWPAWAIGGAAVFVAALTVIAWRQRVTRPWLIAGWAWFLVMLAPVIGIMQVGFQSMADRYTYLPILGLQFMLIWTLRDFAQRAVARSALAVCGLVVLAGAAARTWDQQATWRDSVTLFEHALTATGPSSIAHGFLGYTLLGADRLKEAEEHCRRALELNPTEHNALIALAAIHERRGQLEEALVVRRDLLRLNPTDADTEFALGLLLLRHNRRDEAFPHLRAAAQRDPVVAELNLHTAQDNLRGGFVPAAAVRFEAAAAIAPNDATARFGLGLACAQLDRADDALANYRAAVELQPDFPAARVELGLMLLARDQPAEAEMHFRAALASQPNFGLAHLGAGRAQTRLGRHEEAAGSFERAVALLPNHAGAHRAVAESLARRRRFSEAIAHYERAVQLLPNDANVHAELGYALYFGGRREETKAQWREALRLNPSFPGLRERLDRLP
ncbi:MAG TPA: tetratricopeptide repeat protein, partial [Opitutaceae bacterium]|nr:tetratricopeptide repeat protein [Opitutaceae bacterium]